MKDEIGSVAIGVGLWLVLIAIPMLLVWIRCRIRERRIMRRIDAQNQMHDIPAGWEYHRLEPPTLDKALRNFRVELAPGRSFDIYLARLMLDSSEKRSVGDEEITELPRYEDFCRSALVGVLREYLHNALAVKIERYLADAYVRIREVGDPNLIAAEREVAGIFSIPADSPLNAELAAKRTGDTDNTAANGDDGGEERSGK